MYWENAFVFYGMHRLMPFTIPRNSEARCFTIDNECLGVTNEKVKNGKIDGNAKSRNQCIIPFKHNNVEYMTCTMVDSDGLWCATKVDANLDWQTKGFCTESCQFEGMCFLQF